MLSFNLLPLFSYPMPSYPFRLDLLNVLSIVWVIAIGKQDPDNLNTKSVLDKKRFWNEIQQLSSDYGCCSDNKMLAEETG